MIKTNLESNTFNKLGIIHNKVFQQCEWSESLLLVKDSFILVIDLILIYKKILKIAINYPESTHRNPDTVNNTFKRKKINL